MFEGSPGPKPPTGELDTSVGLGAEQQSQLEAETQTTNIPVIEAVAENAPQPVAVTTETATNNDIKLRPAEEGEWKKMVDERPQLMDENDPDYLPIAAMGHEPWTFDLKEAPAQPEKPAETPAQDPAEKDNTGNDGGGESTPQTVEDVSDKFNKALKEREKKEKEAGKTDEEAEASAEEEFWNNPDDPRKKIGDVINERIDELKNQGSSEADAHAEAHDEFWGKTPENAPGNGGGEGEPPEGGEEPPEGGEGEPTPEAITSPELEEALTILNDARSELARLRAGRESATFFSNKFSKKKLEAAFEAYEEAKAEAGRISVELLRERGLTGQELLSAINWGSMDEAVKLIEEQYQIEVESVESRHPITKKFYNWWNKQGTKLFSLGTIKKGAAMAAIGAPIGAAVGIAGIVAAPVVGAGLAAGAGFAAARSVTRGLVGNKVRRNAEAANVAEAKAQQRHIEAQQIIDALEQVTRAEEDDFVENYVAHGYAEAVNEGMTDQARTQTNETKRGNDRRALTSMAVAAGAGAIAALAADGIFGGGGGDRVTMTSGPRPEADYNPNFDRMRGILDSGPDAPAKADAFFSNIEPGTPQSPEVSQIDQIWESIKDQLSPQQDRIYNQVVGRLSATEGYGNGWTIQNADRIFDLVKQGNSVDQVISQLNVAPQTV